jgi:hypothetical protein
MTTLTEPEQYIADLFEIPHKVFYELNMKVNTILGTLTFITETDRIEMLRKCLWDNPESMKDFNKIIQGKNFDEFLAGLILIELAFYGYDSDDFNKFLKYYHTIILENPVV